MWSNPIHLGPTIAKTVPKPKTQLRILATMLSCQQTSYLFISEKTLS